MGALIRDIRPEDLDWVHALNRTHELELSPLDAKALAALIANATYARAVEEGAFLTGFDQNGAYDSPNFEWHKARFGKFLYVDRIAVAETHRRRGLARLLYEDFFAFAVARGLERIVCEVNSEPPNEASNRFHAELGFEKIGEARLEGRGKTVAYFVRELNVDGASSAVKTASGLT